MVKIQRKQNGQIVVTIDKSLAAGLDIDGGELAEWSVASRNALRLDIIDRQPEDGEADD